MKITVARFQHFLYKNLFTKNRACPKSVGNNISSKALFHNYGTCMITAVWFGRR